MKKKSKRRKTPTIGPKAQKLLVLLQAGITLSLTSRPDVFFKVIRETSKELRNIEQRTLQRAIRTLYRSNLVGYEEHGDGMVALTLTEDGAQRVLQYSLGTMTIPTPALWDGYWRVVAFDIPERLKKGRNAFSAKLKELGFLQLQKSVFIFPHECKNELDFVIEAFSLRPFVRVLLVKETDIDLDLRHRFGLS
ncbi:MAG: hypothetical protein AAB581_02990 [Patescibacteria group bacterium]